MNPVSRLLGRSVDVLMMCLAAAISAGHPAMAADRPNIILCMADEME